MDEVFQKLIAGVSLFLPQDEEGVSTEELVVFVF